MIVLLEHLHIWNMLNCAEQAQILKYKTYAYPSFNIVTIHISPLFSQPDERCHVANAQSHSSLLY